jgi:hypothetical protein
LSSGPREARAADDSQLIDLGSGSPPLTPQQMNGILPYLANPGVRTNIARTLNLREVAGKPVNLKTDGPLDADMSTSRVDLASDFDAMVSSDATSIVGQQRNPSVAVHPLNQNLVVVMAENTSSLTGNASDCSVYVSNDGGVSYSYVSDAPYGSAAPHHCASPKILFSPDGQYLYATYLDVSTPPAPAAPVPRVVVIRYASSAPGGAYSGFIGGTNVDSPSLGVHASNDPTGVDSVYWTFVEFGAPPACSVAFYHLTGYLTTFASGAYIANSSACTGGAPLSNRVLQGPTVAGGPGTQVLACWFDAGKDGYSTPVQYSPPVPPTPVAPLNKFNIACRSSNDRGATFAGSSNPPESVTPPNYTNWIYAAKDVVAELPYWLGPKGFYFYIGASNYPSLAIDHLGNAHIAFSYNPATTNRFTAESANVAYIKSINSAPTTLVPTIYSKWSLKTPVASGAGAQLFPTVVAQHVHESAKPYIYVGWLDTIASVPFGTANANIIYDARYKVSKTGGPSFGTAIVSSDHASTSDYFSVGNYLGSAAGPGIFHFVWTDNRFSFSPASAQEHIFSDRN